MKNWILWQVILPDYRKDPITSLTILQRCKILVSTLDHHGVSIWNQGLTLQKCKPRKWFQWMKNLNLVHIKGLYKGVELLKLLKLLTINEQNEYHLLVGWLLYANE